MQTVEKYLNLFSFEMVLVQLSILVSLSIGLAVAPIDAVCQVVASTPPSTAQSSRGTRPDAAEILRSLLRAVENMKAVAYDVRREHTAADGTKYNGVTRVLATRSPFRFRAKLDGQEIPVKQLAVSDGKATRASTDGEASDASIVFSSRGGQVILNAANEDVAATWRLFLDLDHINKAIESRNIMFVSGDEIEGEACHIVLYSRPLTTEASAITEYIWISAITGLPRAMQRWSLQRGRTRLGTQYIISNIKPDPSFSPETFSYVPIGSDSSKIAKSNVVAPKAPAGPRPGTALPDLEVMNMEYKRQKLVAFKGQPTLINFWAPWCGPCMGELPVLEKIQQKYQGKLRVVAIAVQDSRINVVEFVRKMPQYKFTFLTDPDLTNPESRLSLFFGVRGLPVSIFVDAQGRVIDRWLGFDGEEKLTLRLQKLMAQYGSK